MQTLKYRLMINMPVVGQPLLISLTVGYCHRYSVADKQGYVNLKGYYEFNADRPSGWNMWLTFSISPAAQMPPPRSAIQK